MVTREAVIAGLLKSREDAIRDGDASKARCCTFELQQKGYVEEAPTLETTAAAPLPENTARPRAARPRKKRT